MSRIALFAGLLIQTYAVFEVSTCSRDEVCPKLSSSQGRQQPSLLQVFGRNSRGVAVDVIDSALHNSTPNATAPEATANTTEAPGAIVNATAAAPAVVKTTAAPVAAVPTTAAQAAIATVKATTAPAKTTLAPAAPVKTTAAPVAAVQTTAVPVIVKVETPAAPASTVKTTVAPVATAAAPAATVRATAAPAVSVQTTAAPIAKVETTAAPVSTVKTTAAPVVATVKATAAPAVATVKTTASPAVATVKVTSAPVATVKATSAPVATVKATAAPVATVQPTAAPAAEDSPGAMAGKAAGDAAHIQWLGMSSGAFCTDIGAILAQARESSVGWAKQFGNIAKSGVNAHGEAAGASNAWANAFQELSEAWATAWKNDKACTSALADISEEARIASVAWKEAFDELSVLQVPFAAGAAVSASNTWAYSFVVIFSSFASSIGEAHDTACVDVKDFAAVYQEVNEKMLNAMLGWASHFRSYDGTSYGEKASAVNSWADTLQRAADVINSASGTWAAGCQVSATEAEVASSAVAYLTSNFSSRLVTASEAWTKTFQGCAVHKACLASAASASNTWASITFSFAFGQASEKWRWSALDTDEAMVEKAAEVWASRLSEVIHGARLEAVVWSKLFYGSETLGVDTIAPFAASASNTWAWCFQTFGSALFMASETWSSSLTKASATWTVAYQEVALQMEPAMKAWSYGFLSSSSDLALSQAASASNSWVFALTMLSHHVSHIAHMHGKLGDETMQGYLNVSNEWAQSFLTIAQTANETATQWVKAFSSAPEELSDAASGSMLSSADSWAYLLSQISERTVVAGHTWTTRCEGCDDTWIAVEDFLLLVASSSNSPGRVWTELLGLSEFPDSWLNAIFEIKHGKKRLPHQDVDMVPNPAF